MMGWSLSFHIPGCFASNKLRQKFLRGYCILCFNKKEYLDVYITSLFLWGRCLKFLDLFLYCFKLVKYCLFSGTFVSVTNFNLTIFLGNLQNNKWIQLYVNTYSLNIFMAKLHVVYTEIDK